MRIGKRVFSFIAVGILATALVGCGTTVVPTVTPTATSGSTTPSNSQPATTAKYILRIGHTLSPNSHYNNTAMDFAKLVKQNSNGQIDVQVFPQSQLGGEVQMTQALRTGTQEMEISAEAPIEDTIKSWAVLSIPYLFNSVAEANKVLQGPVGKKFLDMMPQYGLIGLGWTSATERDLFTAKKPVNNLNDIKGMTIRVMQSPGYVNAYKALGSNPSPLAYNELYMALQQGVVDGADTSPDQFVQDKFIEVSKYFALTHVNYLAPVLAISKSTWDKLPADLQKVVQDAATQACQFDIQDYQKQYQASLDTMKAKGVQITKVDTAPWAQAVAGATAGLLKNIPDGKALYDQIKAAEK
ncbi:MAG: TRAP transporter substrate-binding protein [Desulfitobacteriaceae bacterium]